MVIVYAIAAIVLLLIVYYISAGSRLRRQQMNIQEADSGIDAALSKRYDTLTKMFDLAKSYLNQEQETILQSIHLRQHMPLEEKAEAERALDEAARQIRLVADACPALTGQAAFVELQKAATDTEEHLQAARRLYNADVSALNRLVASFPVSIVAGVQGIGKQPMYEAEGPKRGDVNADF